MIRPKSTSEMRSIGSSGRFEDSSHVSDMCLQLSLCLLRKVRSELIQHMATPQKVTPAAPWFQRHFVVPDDTCRWPLGQQ
jgi:hypothetical protein